jgi:hypothetical protein
MKMHPKPALRHTHRVEPFSADVIYVDLQPAQPFHVLFTRQADGATQLLTMTDAEAFKLITNLAAAMRFRGQTDLPADDLKQFLVEVATLTTGE